MSEPSKPSMRINARPWAKKVRQNVLGLSADVWVAWVLTYVLVSVVSQRDPGRYWELSLGFAVLSLALSIYCLTLHASIREDQSKRERSPYIRHAIQFFDATLMVVISHLLFNAMRVSTTPWIHHVLAVAFMVMLGLALIVLIDAVVRLVAATHELRTRVEG